LASKEREHQKELKETRRHYEVQLAESRLKIETLSLTIADRTLQAFNLMSVSHTVSDLTEKAKERVDPAYKPPAPDPEDMLSGDEHDFFLDTKDGFWEVERNNGRSEKEIENLWEKEFKFKAIQHAHESILQ
jgi:hypothetical protein